MGDRGPIVLAVAAAMIAIATAFVLLRMLSRIFIVHRVKLDDYFIVVAWVLAFSLSFSICYATKYGLGRHQHTLSDPEVETLERLEYTFSVLYNPTLMATKTSICIFYLTLAEQRPVFKWSVIGTLAIVNVAGLALSFLNIFQCRPLSATFDFPRAETAHCTDIITLYLSSAPVNIITDLILLLLPMPIVKGMWMPRKQKIILYITFGFGVFITAVDIVRIAYLQSATQNRLKDLITNKQGSKDSTQETDFSWYASLSFMWTAIEVNVGIMVASVPHLKPIVSRFIPKLLRDVGEQTPRKGGSVATMSSADMAIVQRVPSMSAKGLKKALKREKVIKNSGNSSGDSNDAEEDEGPELSFEAFLAATAPKPGERPDLKRSDTVMANASDHTVPGSSFLNFIDMSESKSIVYLSNRESIRPILLVTVLFFIWGFAYGLLNTLNGQFQLIASMSKSETLAQHGLYFAGYLFGPLTVGRLTLKAWGFKACYIIGLMIYGTGTLVFWPAAVLTSFAAFLISNFLVGFGLSILEIAANPFLALCGPPRYAEARLNFSQGVQAIGSVLSPLLAQKVLFGNVKDAPSLIDVQWTYLAISLFTFLLAFVYYAIDLPEATDNDFENATQQTYPEGVLQRFRGNNTIFITLGLAVAAQFFYVGGQEANGTEFGTYLSTVMPGANFDNYLAIAHTLFAVARFIGAFFCLFIKPRYILLVFFGGAVIFSALAMSFSGDAGTAIILMLFFFEGPLFALIFAQALRGLGKHTKDGATLITAAVSGGSVFSPIQYAVANSRGTRYSYCVVVATYAAGLAFALYLNLYPYAREQCDPRSHAPKIEPPSSLGLPALTAGGNNDTNLTNEKEKGDLQFDSNDTGLDFLTIAPAIEDHEPRSPTSFSGDSTLQTPASTRKFSFSSPTIDKHRLSHHSNLQHQQKDTRKQRTSRLEMEIEQIKEKDYAVEIEDYEEEEAEEEEEEGNVRHNERSNEQSRRRSSAVRFIDEVDTESARRKEMSSAKLESAFGYPPPATNPDVYKSRDVNTAKLESAFGYPSPAINPDVHTNTNRSTKRSIVPASATPAEAAANGDSYEDFEKNVTWGFGLEEELEDTRRW